MNWYINTQPFFEQIFNWNNVYYQCEVLYQNEYKIKFIYYKSFFFTDIIMKKKVQIFTKISKNIGYYTDFNLMN